MFGFGTRRRSKLRAAILSTAVALTAIILSPAHATAATTPTPAAPPHAPIVAPIHIEYSLTGDLRMPTITGVGKVMDGKLTTDMNLRTGEFTGTATLPDVNVVGTIYGFIPTLVTISFTQVGPLNGTLDPSGNVTAEVNVGMALKAVNAFGSMPLTPAGCTMQAPAAILLTSDGRKPAGAIGAASLAGKFATGPLTKCGSLTGALSNIFAGGDNSFAFALTLQD